MKDNPSGQGVGVRVFGWINGLVVGLLKGTVRVYQGTLGRFVGGRCRFVPSCSEYFLLAVDRYGPWRGGVKGVWRILRCHPFSRGGVDWP